MDRKYRDDQAEKDKHFAVAFDDMARGFYRSLGIEGCPHLHAVTKPWNAKGTDRSDSSGTVCRKFTKWVTSETAEPSQDPSQQTR